MKHRSIGIKWKVFAYFAIFVAVLLTLLWTFQTVFLESFYKAIKSHDIRTNAQIICNNIESRDLQTLVDEISSQNDMGVRVLRTAEKEFVPSKPSANAIVNQMSVNELFRYYRHALDNDGVAFDTVVQKSPILYLPGFLPQTSSEHMIYVKVLTMSDGREAMIALSSQITPVGATVYTLRIQLIWITVILLVLSAVLVTLLSRKISKPIVTLNEKAKGLAVGNYSLDFSADGYREISELGDTLNYAAGELSTVETLRRDLLANVSHDLRTPLTLITGYSQAMRDLPGENTPENIQIIIDEADRLSLLVSDIMDLSKLQSGTEHIEFKPFAFTDNLRSIAERFSVLTRPNDCVIDFQFDIDVAVVGDEKQLSRVAYNLIQNALQHIGDDNTVTVTQKVRNGFVRVEVKDNGVGIPSQELTHIWDRYYKLDRTKHDRSTGTGLGLSIVQAILKAHNARYGVESVVGQGSTFWYELPIAREDVL